MAFAFEESPAGLVYTERQPMWVRIFMAVVGTGILIIPIAVVRGDGAWRSLPFPSLLFSAVPVLLSIWFTLLMWTAAWRGEQRILFDARRRIVQAHPRGALGPRRSVIGFECIESVRVVCREAVDDPPYWQIELLVAGRRRPLQLGTFATPGEAEQWRLRLIAQISAAPGAPAPSIA